jgi:nicotinamide riboside kinase
MKIALTGSSSTGKTTLAKELCLQSIVKNYITVDAREIMGKYNIKNIDNFTDHDYLLFQKEWIESKIEIENIYDSFITDRSYIDAIGYMKSKNIIDQVLINKCIEKMSVYDFVFYLPYGSIDFLDDGHRSNNIDFNKQVDEEILNLLENENIKYYKVDISNLQDRVLYIKQVIDK